MVFLNHFLALTLSRHSSKFHPPEITSISIIFHLPRFDSSMSPKQGTSVIRTKKEKMRSFHHTTNDERLAMLIWLETPSNRDILDERAVVGKPVSGKGVKKTGYEGMAQFVNQRCKTKWDYRIAMTRYAGYRKLYNTAKRECKMSGFGSQTGMWKTGLHPFKLNWKICAHILQGLMPFTESESTCPRHFKIILAWRKSLVMKRKALVTRMAMN